ncbi:MAG: integrase [Candidatus Binatia bacterium]
MPTEDKMTIDERRKYLRIMRPRYLGSNRKGRSELLDEMEKVTGLDRKTLIRLMSGSLARRPRRKQRGRTYGPAVDDALRVISESFDYLCAERLTPNLVWMATHLAAHGEMKVSPALLEQLGQISVSTVRRILKRIGQDRPRLPRKGPERANRVTRDIPMKRIPWDEQVPGHFEADLVHHCGPSASGEYVHTLQMIDVATGWSERVALLGRSYLAMEDAFCRILTRLPFLVREVHPDNGGEFFSLQDPVGNHHLVRFWKEKVRGVYLSRSRPFQKNDNRFVEQKNDTLVRRYLGYDRLDSAAQTRAVNDLYDKLWLYYNFFQPVMRLKEKTYIPREGQSSRIKRRFDQAQTPFDRLCSTAAIPQDRREELERLREQTNPRRLRREICELIDHIFALPGAVSGETEDVFQTLTTSLSSQKGRGCPVIFSFDRTIVSR